MESVPCKQCGNYYSHKKNCNYWASTGMSEAMIMLEIKQRVLDDTYKLEDKIKTLQAENTRLREQLSEAVEVIRFDPRPQAGVFEEKYKELFKREKG